jgi:hypothetical protein
MESFRRLINSTLARELRCRKENGSLRLEFWQRNRFVGGVVLPPEEARMLLSGTAYSRGEDFVVEMLKACDRYSEPQLLEQ